MCRATNMFDVRFVLQAAMHGTLETRSQPRNPTKGQRGGLTPNWLKGCRSEHKPSTLIGTDEWHSRKQQGSGMTESVASTKFTPAYRNACLHPCCQYTALCATQICLNLTRRSWGKRANNSHFDIVFPIIILLAEKSIGMNNNCWFGFPKALLGEMKEKMSD